MADSQENINKEKGELNAKITELKQEVGHQQANVIHLAEENTELKEGAASDRAEISQLKAEKFLSDEELEKWKQTVLVIQERDNVKQFSEDSYKYFGPYLTHDVDEFDAENKNEERIEKWVKEGRAAFFKKVEQHLIRGNFQPFLDSLKDDPRGAKFIKYCMEIPPILKVGSKLAHRAKGSALPISISKFLNKSKYSHLTTNYLLEIDDYFANFILPKSPV